LHNLSDRFGVMKALSSDAMAETETKETIGELT